MKCVAIILVVYFAALFAVPCSDARNRCEEDTPTTHNQHSHDQSTQHECSPFCYCACYGVSKAMIWSTLPTASIPDLQYNRSKSVIRSISILSNYYGTIWQPPKIAA